MHRGPAGLSYRGQQFVRGDEHASHTDAHLRGGATDNRVGHVAEREVVISINLQHDAVAFVLHRDLSGGRGEAMLAGGEEGDQDGKMLSPVDQGPPGGTSNVEGRRGWPS